MNTLKRLGAALLCLLLLLSAVPGALAGEEAPLLLVGQAGGQRGETVTLEVGLSALGGIAGGGFSLVYDPAALTLVSAEAGAAMAGRLCNVNPHYNDRTVRVSFAGTAPLTETGPLVKLTFTLRKDAALGDSPVKAENVKLIDTDSQVVSRAARDGFVTVQAVAMSLSEARCLPGQSVKLEVLLDGPLAPCGGEFELVYDPAALTAGSVKPEAKLGGAAITLSAGVDNAAGTVKVSWAAADPASPPGRLCTVVFQTAETASGVKAVGFRNVRFYNAAGQRMDALPPTDGSVTLVSDYNDFPTLYMVGGRLDPATRTARVQLAVDGAGIVCGGRFRFSYDPALATLLEMDRKMGCVAVNPETPEGADGSFLVTWAEDSPALDNEPVLELLFRLEGDVPAPLTISEPSLKDASGSSLELFQAHSGSIGVLSGLQAPVSNVVREEEGVTVNAVLYDAMYCGPAPTSGVRAVLAGYSGGRLIRTELPVDAIVFDAFGVAHVKLDADLPEDTERLRVFFVDESGSFLPMCSTIDVASGG